VNFFVGFELVQNDSQRQGTILVVENEPGLLRVVSAHLGRKGYRVLPCRSPEEAFEHWSQNQGEIDLILTDLELGAELNGADLAAIFVRQKPALKIVYMSGGHFHLLGPGSCEGKRLEKPFTSEALLSAVER
jgi:DNA-binding NtrC family response regulator